MLLKDIAIIQEKGGGPWGNAYNTLMPRAGLRLARLFRLWDNIIPRNAGLDDHDLSDLRRPSRFFHHIHR